MANNSALILVGAVGAAAALVGYHVLNKPPPATGGGSTGKPFVAPSNLQQLMLAAWTAAGRPMDQDGWVRSVLPLFPGQVTYPQWAFVYTQVIGGYQRYGTWPSESQLESWLNLSVNGT